MVKRRTWLSRDYRGQKACLGSLEPLLFLLHMQVSYSNFLASFDKKLIHGIAQHFHLADNIIVLGSDRKIAQQGTYDSLRSLTGNIGSLPLHAVKSHDTSSVQTKQGGVSVKALGGATPGDAGGLARKTDDIGVYSMYDLVNLKQGN